ncbi:MAG TPA: hypothetical protein VJZ72_06730 [Candidatus Limnocylindrales bacterium]|nr:hypothetical protein [Candidatus Limnocylindrales bacterium]
MSDDRTEQRPTPADVTDEQDTADDDVEGHVYMRPAGHSASASTPGDDEDVEGHAMFRSPASRGE